MSRYLSLRAAALGVLLVAGLVAMHCARRSPAPLNLLVITIDTLRADRLGCYGCDRPTTPHIDRLAGEGVQFTRVCCQAPLTLPSHCSIFTSRYTLSHGSLGHAYPLNENVRTLAEIARSRGMATAAFVSNHVLDRGYGLARGFDTYWEAHQYSLAALKGLKKRSEDPTTDAALRWLGEHRGERFFLWVHWFHPHKPYDPPPDYARRFAGQRAAGREWTVKDFAAVWEGSMEISAVEVERLRALYDGEVAFSDAQLGRLLEELKNLGLYDRTLIVFTSDHGEVLYEHDRYFGHDIMLYEPCMLVPLVIRHPDWPPARLAGLVQSIDIMPTALSALGITTDAPLEGRDLTPLVLGDADATTQIAVTISYPPREKSLPKFGLRTEDWKLILNETADGFERELYNLAQDPGEKVNLAAEDPERADALQRYYADWSEAVRAHALTSEPRIDEEALENLRSLGYIQ